MKGPFEPVDLERLRTDADKRGEWIEEDPSKLFRLLALEETSDEDRDEFERRLELALETPREPRAADPPRSIARWGWAAAAAAVALLLWAGSAFLPGAERGVQPAKEFAATESAPIESSLPELEPIQPSAFRDDSLHGVAVLATPGEARVVDLSVGETRVVMIFDEELDL